MATQFVILGSGAWGTAIALALAQNPDHRVTLWSARTETANTWFPLRENVRLLPGVAIPEAIHLTTEMESIQDADLLVSAIPTIHLRSVMVRIQTSIRSATPVLSLTKGLELGTFQRPTEILREVLGPRSLGVLSGPSHAEEVTRGMPTTLVAASEDLDLARWVQQRFSTERIRVYTNLDVLGVELAGALKNVIGIAAGICEGLGFGDNAKSALMTRGLAEMARFGVAMGADAGTFWGLAGMGDLITTCISQHGRNRAIGLRLARGESLEQILATMSMVAEGIYTAKSVHDRAREMRISMPITHEVFRVLYEKKDPRQAVSDLMLRQPKSE